jgi:hypothetical protein
MYSLKLTARLLLVVAVAGLISCSNPPAKPLPGALPAAPADGSMPRLNATTYFAHGHLLERQGNLEQAVDQYQQALAAKPDFATARNRLGITLNKLGRNSEATIQLRQALTAQPNLAYLHNNLGFSLFLEGKFPDAETEFARALQLNPGFTRARMNHALVLARLDRMDDALGEFRLASDEPTAHYNFAMVLADAQRYEAAVRELDTALRIQPQFQAAKDQLKVLAPLALQTQPPAPAPQPAPTPVQPAMTVAAETVPAPTPAPAAAPLPEAPPVAEASPPVTLPTPVEQAAETQPPPPPAELPGADETVTPAVPPQEVVPVGADDCDDPPPDAIDLEDLPEVPVPSRFALSPLTVPLPPVTASAPPEIDISRQWWPRLTDGTSVPFVTYAHDVLADFDLLRESWHAQLRGRTAWNDFWRDLEATLGTKAVTEDPLSAPH